MKKITFFLALAFSLFISSCGGDIWDVVEENERVHTYIAISDLHLGDELAISKGYAENIENRETVVAFLDYLLTREEPWDELIINGDLFDEWCKPSDQLAFLSLTGEPLSQREYLASIVRANQKIFDKLYELKNAEHSIIYVIGNHDMLVTGNDVEAVLPGLFVFCGEDGKGVYDNGRSVVFEHGHIYDIFNAPYFGKERIDGIASGSMLPPGYFVNNAHIDLRISGDENGESMSEEEIQELLDRWSEDGESELASADEEFYDLAWYAMQMSGLQFNEVMTGIDGMTETYSFEDYATGNARLFKGIDQYEGDYGWNKRCHQNWADNDVSIRQSVLSNVLSNEFDKIGLALSGGNSTAPVIVHGHTHKARLLTKKDYEGVSGIYANSGCWIDEKYSSPEDNNCFVIVAADLNVKAVELCQFSISGGQPKVITKGSATVDTRQH